MAEPDNMDHFNQEAHSFMDLNEQKEVMVQEARTVLAEHPSADPVAMLLQADSPLALGLFGSTNADRVEPQLR